MFTTESRTTADHGGMHMLITNGGAIKQSTSGLPGSLKSQVGHDCGHKSLIRKRTAVLQR